MIINMTSGGVVPERILDAQTITPGKENQVIEEETFLRGALTVLGDEDLTPENIRNGVELFGVSGTFKHEEEPNLVAENIRDGVEILGVTGTMKANNVVAKSGTYKFSSQASSISIPHGLGKTPTYAGFTNVEINADYGGEDVSIYSFATNASNITAKCLMLRPVEISWFAVLVE